MGPTWGLQWKNISTAENICDTQHGLPVATTPITDRMNAMRPGEQALAWLLQALHIFTSPLQLSTSTLLCHIVTMLSAVESHGASAGLTKEVL